MNRQHVMSSLIESVGYDAGSSTLEVKFVRGAVWQYYGVPPAIAGGLIDAPSVGKYFLANIRENYEAKTV